MKRFEQDEARAKNYVFRLLAYRNRSQKEIRDKLYRRKYSSQTIKKVISRLESLGYVDDARFAREWIDFRLKSSFGLKKIILELRQKGIGEDILKLILQQVRFKDSESDVLASLTNKKMRSLRKQEKDGIKVKGKLYRYLLGRGFSSGDIITVLDRTISR
ncbi:MAG: recombination regulator RecX [Candidatus Omnitrophica bacterium]|nr:recombination regulator RecX [Candidatus Omnitrophota bacterium]